MVAFFGCLIYYPNFCRSITLFLFFGSNLGICFLYCVTKKKKEIKDRGNQQLLSQTDEAGEEDRQ